MLQRGMLAVEFRTWLLGESNMVSSPKMEAGHLEAEMEGRKVEKLQILAKAARFSGRQARMFTPDAPRYGEKRKSRP